MVDSLFGCALEVVILSSLFFLFFVLLSNQLLSDHDFPPIV